MLPASSELVLRDRDGTELSNRARFDQYHRYAGTSSVSYGPAAAEPLPSAPARGVPPFTGRQITAALDAALGDDACIGDPFTATAADGTKVAGRIAFSLRQSALGMVGGPDAAGRVP